MTIIIYPQTSTLVYLYLQVYPWSAASLFTFKHAMVYLHSQNLISFSVPLVGVELGKKASYSSWNTPELKVKVSSLIVLENLKHILNNMQQLQFKACSCYLDLGLINFALH